MTSPAVPNARDTAQQIHAALDANQVGQAIALALQALKAGIKSPQILNLAAFAAEQQGRFQHALKLLAEAERLAPQDPAIQMAIGRCFLGHGHPAHARLAFERAIAFNPNLAPAHHGRGAALGALGKEQDSFESQARAIELDPNFPAALGALADMSLRRADKAAARRYAARAVSHEPFQPSANQVLATLDAESGQRDAAISRLEKLHSHGAMSPQQATASQHQFAGLLEAAGRTEDAFQAYAAAKRATLAIHGRNFEQTNAETGRALCRRLEAYFAAAPMDAWRAAPGRNETGATGHVFLMGFVRSGTTLLEQVLASHPDIVALEEMPTLRAIAPAFFEKPDGLDRLAALDACQAETLRRDYWTRVKACGAEVEGKIFIDKAPLASPLQPLIAKLFPDARIIFARRDPRDVVLSVFRNIFLVTALSASFTDLEDTARFYGELMRLSELYRERLGIPTHIHVHEAMIADFDAETAAICAFLGIGWVPQMRAFAQTARRRDVRTPSVDQVRRELNSSGIAQWRRYETQMAAVLPILEPWVERFGYPPS